jgi:hypothetical protein
VLLGANGTGQDPAGVDAAQCDAEQPEGAVEGIKATPSLVLGYGDQALADLDDHETPMRTIIRRFDIGDASGAVAARRRRHDHRDAGQAESGGCRAGRRRGSGCWRCG